MYNDLLGENKKSKEAMSKFRITKDKITFIYEKNLIDDLYALHGMKGVKSFLKVANELLTKAAVNHVRCKHKENKKYYKERAQSIIKKMEEIRNATRNES